MQYFYNSDHEINYIKSCVMLQNFINATYLHFTFQINAFYNSLQLSRFSNSYMTVKIWKKLYSNSELLYVDFFFL